MVRRAISLALAGAASLFPPSVALAQTAPGSVFVRIFGGAGSMPMSSLDGHIADNLSTLLVPGTPRWNTEDLGFAGLLGGEVGYMLHSRWSAGLSVTRGNTSASTLFGSLFFDAGSNSLEGRMTDVTASASFWIPNSGGLFAGLEAGAGFGRLEESFGYSDINGNEYRYEGRWKGSGFVGGVFAGFQHRFHFGPLGFARVGYKLRNLGELPGQRTVTASTYSGLPTGTTRGPIRDSSGRALESDFSLFHAELGLGLAFGGR